LEEKVGKRSWLLEGIQGSEQLIK